MKSTLQLALIASSLFGFSISASAEKPESIVLLDPSLSHWDAFIGTPHKTVKGLPEGTEMSEDGMKGKPLGLNNDPKKVFSTYQEEGTTVLKVSGEIYGGLTTKKEFSNYHFETDFKWGSKKWEPRLDKKLDSGILYHCHGEHGKFWNVWKASLEYQVQEGDMGDYFGLSGVDVKARVLKEDGKGAIHDPEQPWQNDPGYIGARPEVEEPHGEWNKLEVYVIGDSAIHVVNGQMVLSIADARTKNGDPLTAGEIQLQSEAAECYYRNMKVTPITTFPKDLAEKAGLAVTGGIAAKSETTKDSTQKVSPLSGVLNLLDPELSRWEVFMGVAHTSVPGLPEGTPQSEDVTNGTPMGLNNDPKNVFSTKTENGETILHITGEIYGALSTKESFSNYYLEMDFKWGDRKWIPRLDAKRDSGILYHCHGDHGAFWNVWKSCIEYQVQETDLGDLHELAGPNCKSRFRTLEPKKHIFDHQAPSPWTEWDGHLSASHEPDRPHGEWNHLEVYLLGDTAIHIANGVVVLAIVNAVDGSGKTLTSGQIQLQSEAAECFYKNIRISPIKAYPADIAAKAGLTVDGKTLP